ncbi:NADH-quinone oxidoreductase subunit NuoN [Chromobacterium violaceum]|uniref:NADH-quinone oxidoreductase subunit N n=3 Tax=Chromobacterium violaceum TaxID=536 RepID=A0A1R0MCF5_CHRVL|nr:NADH-quinone oxidoreductase subunit NuoN [Chromobacterium violaceum]AAQ58628.1 NADH-ubiquinone oxidoreductase, chain N [Chromobacterium violaceum ATCC 12472]MBA8734360.1 NADH-quinone oxidoreductase subunit NuoN [Chromobacterium violaceum]MBT2869365.1 NADH-quinone oxidoreductase subunit NuoN [Chromobacterium violaceum]OLZ75817.1 NADH-quinone oxidoreductase subunit N [Chromobacterium violaceum]OQS09645.1 NADH-quinone oxidoreductase subunit N [Chromobacterium violaceum]
MNWADLNLIPAMPELFLIGALLVVLMLDLFIPDEKRCVTYGLTLLTLVGAAAAQVCTFTPYPVTTFSGMFVADPLAALVKLAMYGVTAIVLVYSRQYTADRGLFKGEYFSLSLFALLGMNLMVSASHFLTLYMGLELLSLALYSLIALQRDSVPATESAMKYFVLGALASGLLLYGISMIYGATGSLELAAVAKSIKSHSANGVLLIFGLVFIVAGLSFKLGAVPFHMWVPDVYQGSPTSVTLMVGAAPKLAAFVFVLRILAQGLDALAGEWQGMLVIVAVLSMAIGNITAIVQTNIKRMLAYSTISHMGFLLLGVLAGTKQGYSAALFYAVVYVAMSMVGFGIILALSRKGFECEKIDDLKGLNSRNSWYAFLMLLAMFSMAGIPPLAGFYAKFAVVQAVVQIGMIKLAVFSVLMSVIGAFYYLRVVKAIYFDDAQDSAPIAVRADMKLVLSLNALALLAVGILPQSLLELCAQAMRQSLGMM